MKRRGMISVLMLIALVLLCAVVAVKAAGFGASDAAAQGNVQIDWAVLPLVLVGGALLLLKPRRRVVESEGSEEN